MKVKREEELPHHLTEEEVEKIFNKFFWEFVQKELIKELKRGGQNE